ncbi:MAG: Panacea domain-containing protein [Kluyvera sp.]|uniref:Panacea domain-containing protein n=1 Tax=Kluyvera sp. TaxID=1538228 RepID=UPI003F38F044
MAYTALAVANAFIDLAKRDGRDLTPMQVQKLAFIANGWMLGMENRPLISSSFEVWRHGPVEPILYQALKKYGREGIKLKISSWVVDSDGDFKTVVPAVPEKDKESWELLKTVWKAYGDLDALTLSEITHLPDAPWSVIKDKHGFNASIPNNLIKDYYNNLIAN